MHRPHLLAALLLALATGTAGAAVPAASTPLPPSLEAPALVPPLADLLPKAQQPAQRMANVLRRYQADRESLDHFYTVPYGRAREAALSGFLSTWRARLDAIDFASLGLEDRLDWVLLERELAEQQRQLGFERERFDAAASLLPEVDALVQLAEDRRLMQPQAGADAAAVLDRARRALAERNTAIARDGKAAAGDATPIVAYRAARILDQVREAVKDWHGFYAGYDPTLEWWVRQPYAELDKTLDTYATTLREQLAGASDPETIVGDPIGEAALRDALRHASIPYSPAELVTLARKELAWCHAELTKAARELGYKDWRAALEHVKTLHPAPGEQPALVTELAWEAIRYLEANDLVTVPELARRDWRMNMLSAERQLQAPFFLGGEDVWVAFPTAEMPHDKKMMSLRGNNRHFSRAVVHHELIPGHHLQHFMLDRYQTQRRLFWTPFWGEGWALYWEFRLYDLGFASSPEDRIGMLFWRAHRAARILFSFGFHLGTMTPAEAIDLLVEQVGHERENAAAEVRRSFTGDYSPIYQAAYMLGGLQFRALHEEVVGSGRMTERAFHDAILQGGPMPIEFVRMRLLETPPSKQHRPTWKFYDFKD
jgi:uncharacterized protein (DUF885 family)